MEKVPNENLILAQEGDDIQLRLESADSPAQENPIFLLNGSTEAVGDVLGVTFENSPNDSYTTSVHLEEPGDHIATAVWATKGDLNLERFETWEEIDQCERLETAGWKVHVFPQSSTLDDLRQFIDDMARVGTVAWVGQELLERINEWRSNDTEPEDYADSMDDENENGDEEHFQKVLTNYD